MTDASQGESFRLKRSLSLPQMVLYGVGTTVGAGIYALVGKIAGVAGYGAPWSFLIASALAGFTAVSFAQMSRRYPRAAGTALYVQQGFGSTALARLVGILVILTGMVSAAALINGFLGYLSTYVSLDRELVIVSVALLLFLIAAWGVSQSVWVAGIISVIEVGGLLWIIYLGSDGLLSTATWSQLAVTPSWATWSAVLTGSVLAFYAYIGFEDMVEVAEEVKNVTRNLPRAIVMTLLITTAVYFLLITAALGTATPEFLSSSDAPLADLYRKLTAGDPIVISLIGLFAIINGALIQVIMASRVIYGLANRGQLPAFLAYVASRNQIPITATALAASIICVLAVIGNLRLLAEVTSTMMLIIFAAVNFALCKVLGREDHGLKNRVLTVTAFCGGTVCALLAGRTALTWIWAP